MKTMNPFKNLHLLAILFSAITIVGCSNDDDAAPQVENVVEVFTDVTLTFTNTADASDVVSASAQDPDGTGIQELQILDAITLAPDTEYILTYEILNALNPADIENIGNEILEEDNEHQFFFSFTEDVFANPTGNGNIDTAADPINYNDQDENGNPVGLSSTWTTSSATSSGESFTVRLQHQPDVKTATSGSNDGDTDFTLTFVLNIQ
ncbi:GTP cyclohydrolase [Olleya sp. HaHaR_3_96]|uniref:GTP cyclohydrolase n=1 Tax=Olleya sp. HaHaR_3_96 TaxID=2745560 RepID=UPI001C50147E|nr:GTP cyclohydrolase [Olleya sp. HaHaR_3_96]QXP58733.1 GTP cyclohydrolase [Olleya sp. HaHaR_3_96]